MQTEQLHHHYFLKEFFALAVVAMLIFLPSSAQRGLAWSALNTTLHVDSVSRYAYGENVGWVDFGNVSIVNAVFSGYAYGENIGWIDMSGVSLNSNGTLTGYGWSENTGWIDFSEVALGQNGAFTGGAYGENIGWINFSNSSYDQVALANIPPEFGSEGVTAKQIATSTDPNYTKVSISYSIADADTSMSPHPGQLDVSFEYNTGSGWQGIPSQYLTAGDSGLKNVDSASTTPYTAYWNIKGQLPDMYSASTQVRVTVNDGRSTGNITQAVSNPFILDTKAPVISSFVLDASADNLSIVANDNSAYSYVLSGQGLNAGEGTPIQLAAGALSTTTAWLTNSSSPSATIALTDAYGNTLTSTASAPAQPVSVDLKDTSNVRTGDYSNFISWGLYPSSSINPFSKYEVWRSVGNGTTTSFTKVSTITDSNVNYYSDMRLSASSTYSYEVRYIDTANNVSPFSNIISHKPNGQGGTDFTPPIITNVAATTMQTTWASVAWTTDELSNSVVDYALSSAPTIWYHASSTSYTTNHSIVLTGLAPSKTYIYKVNSADQLGNLATDDHNGANYTFTTTAGALISNVAMASVTNTSATVVWNTDIPADSYVHFGDSPTALATDNYASVGSSVLVTASTSLGLFSHSVSLINLVSGHTYYYFISSADASGHEADDTNGGEYYYFNTSNNLKPAAISNTRVSDSGATWATISWDTDEFATSKVTYGKTSLSNTASSSAYTVSHSITISGLSPKTTYTYKVSSTDFFDNSSTDDNSGDNYTFTTAAGAVISNVSVTSVSETGVSVIWNTNSSSDSFIEYSTSTANLAAGIYTLAGTHDDASSTAPNVYAHSVSLTDLATSTTYYFIVSSSDEFGNASLDTNSGNYYKFVTAAGVVITSVNSSAGQNDATITWSTNIASDSYVHYAASASDFLIGNYIASGTPALSFSVMQGVYGHSVSVSSLLPDHTYYFSVSSTDEAGMTSVDANGGAGYSFTTAAGTAITNVELTSITDGSVTINWKTNIASDSFVHYTDLPADFDAGTYTIAGSKDLAPASGDSLFVHSVTIDGLSTSTTHYFVITSTDGNGNTILDSNGGLYYSFTTLVDATPPTISNVRYDKLEPTSAVIKWDTDEFATSTVNYGQVAVAQTASSDSYSVHHEIALFGLDPGATYSFSVSSTDFSGNTATDDNATAYYTFTTPQGVMITGVSVASTTQSTAEINWMTNRVADSFVRYSDSASNLVSGNYFLTGTHTFASSTSGLISHDVTLTKLSPDYQYFFDVSSMDQSGMTSVDDNSGAHFNFFTSRDLTAPIITGVSTPLVTANKMIVVWQTNKVSDSQVFYSTDSSATTTSPIDTTPTITHVVTLSGLSTSTEYHFYVRSEDANNNVGVSAVHNVSTSGGNVITNTVYVGGGGGSVSTDSTPPSVFNVTATSTGPFEVTINFETDKVATAYVDYGKDTNYGYIAASHDLVNRHSVKLTGLSMGKIYHYKITAEDSFGNLGYSPDGSFTTPYMSEALDNMVKLSDASALQDQLENLIDSILPSLSRPFITDINVSSTTESSALIHWRTNVPTYATVYYDSADKFSSSAGYSLQNAQTNSKSYTHDLILEGLMPSTLYHFQIQASSLPGVFSTSTDATFTTKTLAIQPELAKVEYKDFQIRWSTPRPTSSIVEYTNTSTGMKNRVEDPSLVSTHSVDVLNLDPNTTYSVRSFGYNSDNNIIEANSLTVRTKLDSTPPVLSPLRIDNALIPGRTDRLQSVVSWKTDKISSSKVYYEEGPGNGTALKNQVEDKTVTMNHIVIISSLKPSTVYRIKIESTDESGNIGSSTVKTILTPQSAENVLDVIINNLQQSFGFLKKLQ